MALKRDTRKGFNPADIRVNRGSALGSLSDTVGRTETLINQTVLDFADNQLTKLKKDEIAKGEMLAQQAEIQYEDFTFTDADGNQRTQKIARSYRTPDDLINTSWAAHAFNEQVAKTYLDAVVVSADDILQTEKQILKGKVRYDTTIPELSAMYAANTNPALQALRSTVPPAMQNIFDAKIQLKINGAQNELANRHHSKREQFFQSDSAYKDKVFEDSFFTRLVNDKKNLEDDLAELTGTMEQYSRQAVPYADFWMKNKLANYVAMLEISDGLQEFTDVDLTNPNSINFSRSNIINFREAINTGKKTVSFTNQDGSRTTKNIEKDFGIDMDILQNNRAAINTYLTRQSELLTNAGVHAKDNILMNNILTKGGIPTKANAEKIQNALLDQNHPITERLISDFSVAQGRMDYTPDTVYSEENAGIRQNFFEYVANEHGVVHSMIATPAINILTKDPISLQVDDLVGEQGFVNSPAFKFMTNTISYDKDGKIITSSIINKIGLDDKQTDTFYELARNVRAYGPEKGAQIFIDMIQQKAKDTKPRAFSRLDGKSLKDVVTSHIKREYSSLAGRDDNLIPPKLLADVVATTKERYEFGPLRNVTDIASEVMDGFIENDEVTLSEFMYNPSADANDPDETGGRVYTKFAPDKFMYDYNGDESDAKLMLEETISQRLKYRLGTATNVELSLIKPVIGENIFFDLIGQPQDSSQAIFRLRYFDGTDYHFLLTDENREYRLFYDQVAALQSRADKTNISELRSNINPKTGKPYFKRPMYQPKNPIFMEKTGKERITYIVDGKEMSEEEYNKLGGEPIN